MVLELPGELFARRKWKKQLVSVTTGNSFHYSFSLIEVAIITVRLCPSNCLVGCFSWLKSMFGNAKHFLILFIRLHNTWAAFLQLNSFMTGWFPSQFGVKQGDVLSRNLFALHVTDLAQEIKQVDICIWNDDVNLSVCWLQRKKRKMHNIMSLWGKWRFTRNTEKTDYTF